MATTGVTVRLSFPQGEHQDVIVQPGEITIGSAPDNAVVIGREGIQPHHATVVVDSRGYTLVVHGPESWTHVNARPVREKAILRLGDVVSLHAVNMVLKPDTDDSIRGPERGEQTTQPNGQVDTRHRQAPPRVVLRGVSGPFFGKVVPVHGRLAIGRGGDCDLVLDEPEMSRRHAQVEVNANEIFLRDLGSSNGTYVNGVQVRDAVLFPGDQIAFDRNRFLVEAPGMPVRRYEPRPPGAPLVQAVPSAAPMGDAKPQVEVTQTLRAIRPQASAPASSPVSGEPAKGSSWTPWWLIGAGALIAVVIAWLLLGSR